MVAVLSLLVLLALSLLVTRVATVALAFTGLSHESARFQARSAFTGVGFTTNEAESLVNHPVRRRIVMTLMLLGNIGIVTVASSAIISFVRIFGDELHWKMLAVLVAGLAGFVALARSQWVNRVISRAIEWALRRWTDLAVYDYANLLHLSGEYGIAEIPIDSSCWLAGRTLADLKLREEGLVVLGIHRLDGSYIGAPQGISTLREGDTITVYGRAPRIAALDVRKCGPKGENCHRNGVEQQERILEQQEAEEGAIAAAAPIRLSQ
jgi:hypothetical protein